VRRHLRSKLPINKVALFIAATATASALGSARRRVHALHQQLLQQRCTSTSACATSAATAAAVRSELPFNKFVLYFDSYGDSVCGPSCPSTSLLYIASYFGGICAPSCSSTNSRSISALTTAVAALRFAIRRVHARNRQELRQRLCSELPFKVFMIHIGSCCDSICAPSCPSTRLRFTSAATAAATVAASALLAAFRQVHALQESTSTSTAAALPFNEFMRHIAATAAAMRSELPVNKFVLYFGSYGDSVCAPSCPLTSHALHRQLVVWFTTLLCTSVENELAVQCGLSIDCD